MFELLHEMFRHISVTRYCQQMLGNVIQVAVVVLFFEPFAGYISDVLRFLLDDARYRGCHLFVDGRNVHGRVHRSYDTLQIPGTSSEGEFYYSILSYTKLCPLTYN